MKPLALSLLFLALALPAKALSPDAESYLRSIGFDPASEDVRLAEAAGEIQTTYMDEPATFSLESLAAGKKKKNQVTNFIVTRAFIARLQGDFTSTAIPEKNYEALYLTKAERQLVGRKVATSLLNGNPNARPA